jgi:dihydrofolate synthase / folylpolyglutamate synthase
MSARRSLDDWLRLQETQHSQGIDLGLARVRSVAERLQLLPYPLRTIIVAGTNGKGSTVACLAALLRAHGLRAGAFTSPHLLRYHERIRLDGADATDDDLIGAFEAIDAVRADTTLTFFEYNALAALWIFRQRRMDFAVLEVGLGGRLDAVNIVDAEAAIVCSIGLDHADWLGTDIEQIGREKAGVFRAGSLAVIADPSMTPSVAAEASRMGARAVRAGADYTWRVEEAGRRWSFQGSQRFDSLAPPGLPGARQFANAAAAIAALSGMGVTLEPGAISHALCSLQLPGRFQVIPGPVEWILDVAHNEPAARVLAQNLRERPCAGRTLLVAAILGDKDVGAIAPVLAGVADRIFLCGIAAPRGLTATQLAARSPHFATAGQCEDIAAGMSAAAGQARPGDRIVVCGSFLAVAPALERLGLY